MSWSLVSKSITYQSNRLFNIQVIQFKVTKLIGSFFRNNQNTWCIVKHASDVSCNWCNLWWKSRFLGWLTTASSVSGISFRSLFSWWNSIDAGSLSVNVRKKVSKWFQRISCIMKMDFLIIIVGMCLCVSISINI